MAKAIRKTQRVWGREVMMVSSEAYVSILFSDECKRWKVASDAEDIKECSAILRKLCGAPGPNRLWFVWKEGKPLPKMKNAHLDVIAVQGPGGSMERSGWPYAA